MPNYAEYDLSIILEACRRLYRRVIFARRHTRQGGCALSPAQVVYQGITFYHISLRKIPNLTDVSGGIEEAYAPRSIKSRIGQISNHKICTFRLRSTQGKITKSVANLRRKHFVRGIGDVITE